MPSANLRHGRLISFEGPEGSGKTTQIAILAKRLKEVGIESAATREPGGTPLGEEIRNLLKHHASGAGMTPEAELLLFAASRAQLVRELIAPTLQRGAWVLCDRYLDSTTVYQGVARQLGADPVAQINRFAVGELMPHLTFVLDVPLETSLVRIRRRGSPQPDRMEQQNLEFYRKVRDGYLMLARSLPERFRVVDGAQAVDKVAAEIWSEVRERFG